MATLQSAVQLEQHNHRVVTRRERLLLPHMPIQFDAGSSPDKLLVENYIAERFYATHQATVNHFLPNLLSTTTDDKLTAAMGFQTATADNSLFLEQYLTHSIEAEVSNLVGKHVDRDTIAEVGNLTSSHRGTSQMLFILTVAILHQAGFEWAAFTATKQVQKLLAKLDLVTLDVCEANPDSLTDDGQSWGRYYDDKPHVVVGNLTDAMASLEQHRVIGFVLKNYKTTIVNIASKITRK